MTIRTCIIGAGNISNTRHIPAIMKNKTFHLVGTISNDENKIRDTNAKNKIPNALLVDTIGDIYTQLSACSWFMEQVDAVVIGTPPMQHFNMVKACLQLNKHVLVEKPMMMTVSECDEVIALSQERKLVLNVMHSFQFASGILQLEKHFMSGEFGKLESILEIQLSNRKRRLPKWYNELPLGLFYDEAAHFFYTAVRFGGQLSVVNARAFFNNGENTPKALQAQIMAGEIPVQMIMNFNAPICEWGFLLICEKKIAIYDYFKDILIVLDNDNMHFAPDILKTSVWFTLSFWKGFIVNGFRMLTGHLLYGHDIVIREFGLAITEGKEDSRICAQLGREVVLAMNRVVELVKEEN